MCLHAQTNSNAITNTLTKEEQKILSYIDANMPRAIELLKESVNINSGTLNIEGVKKVGALFAKEFETAGLKTHKTCRAFSSHDTDAKKTKRQKIIFNRPFGYCV